MTPDFLIIGAMKAGTTTLHADLSQHPDVFMPAHKEPETLVVQPDEAAMRRDYANLFKPAQPGQMKGEASTAYTKMPTHFGVAATAAAVCGRDLKLIYMTRDPIARMISHYHHDRQHGLMPDGFANAVDTCPELIAYSRYDWQVTPWIEAFGAANLLRLSLEDYSRDRRAVLGRVLDFLGLDVARMPEIDTNVVKNSVAEPKSLGDDTILQRIILSRFYQRTLKPMIPAALREGARRAILPAPKIEQVVIDDDMRAELTRRLTADA